MHDGHGTFELVVKTYFPNSDQPGGAMSNILDSVLVGEEIEVRGPTGEIVYTGQGKFNISDEEMTFKKINLILGGSGLTPGYALIVRAMLGTGENVQLRVVNANKSEKDILLHEELDHLESENKGRLEITHVLSHPSDEWKGLSGHVNEDIIKDKLFPPEEGTASFLCGPPTMIQKVALPALKDWGFEEDKNLFGF
jgi:nitrate reductase (NAD(P)H)